MIRVSLDVTDPIVAFAFMRSIIKTVPIAQDLSLNSWMEGKETRIRFLRESQEKDEAVLKAIHAMGIKADIITA